MSVNKFKHQPLDLNRAQIRLLRLKPGQDPAGLIAIHDLENCPDFKAVSYTWGPRSLIREISLDGQSFTVRENLWQFLSAIRDSTDSWLWIDQICIDQCAVDERNHQVSLMATIYAKAAEVLIWLGPEADGSDTAMEAIDSGRISTESECHVQALFRRPYWDRLWILQEVLMGQNILVLCGSKNFRWRTLEDLFIPQVSDDDGPWEYPAHIRDVALSLIEEKASFEGENQRLSYMLDNFAQLHCEDVRDKVYGLLSLVRSSGVIPVDYSKTSTEVFFNAICKIAEDESFMDFESYWDVARHLRDRMMLADVSDSDILSFLEKELGKKRNKSSPDTDGINQKMQDRQGWDLLFSAARRGDEAFARLLLDSGRDADVKDLYDRTPLSWAAEYGHKAVVQLLLDKGADIEAKDENSGRTSLSWAAASRHEAVMQLLLDKGANVEAKDKNGRTLLSWAAEYGHKAVVQLLLDKGADIEARNENGWTPLLWAAAIGHEAVVQLLLDKGANVEAKDGNGWMPLLWATARGHEAVVQLLLDKGADVEAKDESGLTPLLWAAMYGHEAIVQPLLDKGADVEAKDESGRTPLLWAAATGHEAVVQLLLDKGADVEAKDGNGRTPLLWAVANGHEAVVKLLESHGLKRS